MKYCPNCGSKLFPGAKFCTECGTILPKTTPVQSSLAAESENLVQPEAPKPAQSSLASEAEVSSLIQTDTPHKAGTAGKKLSPLKWFLLGAVLLVLVTLAIVLVVKIAGDIYTDQKNSSMTSQQNWNAAQVDALPEVEASIALVRDAGALESDGYTGYSYHSSKDYAGFDHHDGTGTWHYSNYPNYKDFHADGKWRVALINEFSSTWCDYKADALEETLEAAGCEFLRIDVDTYSIGSNLIDAVRYVINQDCDVVILDVAINTTLLPESITMLQNAGIAYLTAEEPGADAYGFYAPHVGVDNYNMHYELGKYVAGKMAEENWMDGVAEDYSNFLFVIEDTSFDFNHLRNTGFYDGIMESYDIPNHRVVWMDCGDALFPEEMSQQITVRMEDILQTNYETVDKWLVCSGSGTAMAATYNCFCAFGIDPDDYIITDFINSKEAITLMQNDPALQAYGVVLSPAPTGDIIGEIVIDLLENGTPIPARTRFAQIIVDQDSVWKFDEKYIMGG